MYLLDSNVFIQANRFHYGMDFVPGFWDWIDREHGYGTLASIDAVKKELDAGDDALTAWEKARTPLFLAMDAVSQASLTALAAWAIDPAKKYKQAAIEEFMGSADYQLVAYAHAHSHTVVTHERLANPGEIKKIRIPDACNALGVPWLHTFKMLRNERARLVLGPA